MVVELIGGVVLTFAVVVAASYVGAKMALRSFFGREFVDENSGEFVLPPADRIDDPGATDR